MVVGDQGQHPKECAEQALALRYPGDRFDIERVQREECRHHGAAPDCSGHPLQNPEQQDGVRRVQHHVCEVKAAGAVPAKKRGVQFQRKPGQGMPEVTDAAECPADAVGRQAGLNVRIRGDVERIVKIDEGVRKRWTVNDHRRQSEADGKEPCGERIFGVILVCHGSQGPLVVRGVHAQGTPRESATNFLKTIIAPGGSACGGRLPSKKSCAAEWPWVSPRRARRPRCIPGPAPASSGEAA